MARTKEDRSRPLQLPLFEAEREEPLRHAIEFYRHQHGWSNRLIAGEGEGWARLAKNLKAEIDEELIEAYRGTVSLPFEPGGYKRVPVKIVDDRGIESLKVIGVER